jgi:ATP-dependent exoDNAse (exonuclease V) beta subunit
MIYCSEHPSGKILKFDDETHTYTIDDEPLISTTTLIHKFFPVFDTEAISKAYADKYGFNQSDIIAIWEANRIESAQFGTNVHSFAEAYIKGLELPLAITIKMQKYFDVVKQYIDKLMTKYKLLDAELITCDPKLMLAGTVDLVFEHNGRLIILDWKTNKEIKTENKYQNGLGKLKHLPDCNYSHYSLQLNIYKYLITSQVYHKYDDVSLGLLHITEDGIIPYKIKYMDKELNYILKNIRRSI